MQTVPHFEIGKKKDASRSPSKGRVLVAMSGGVDSSAAAAILIDQGYDVVGITMQVWDYSACEIEEGNGTCCSSIDVDDARAVADKLNFPFYVMNCEAKFKTEVIDPFVSEYLQGRTPLPCVNCNTYLKFDHLFVKMKELNCDYLATGHYAQIITDESGRAGIVTSTDDHKDQTYFLFTLNPEVIKYVLFPIGHMKKPEVRKVAEEKGLLNARKKDSTGICFVGKLGYQKFIESQVDVKTIEGGVIKRYPTGEVLGDHTGIHNFTYGQRRGLGMSHHETLYVLSLDPVTKTVWVGEEKYLFKNSAEIKDINWLTDVSENDRLRIKVRYQHGGAHGRVIKTSEGFKIEFEEPQRAITPGQAAVFYRDNQLVGGGWIVQ